MMNLAVHRLNEDVRAALTAHFLALPVTDRRLRFCTPLAPQAIAAYVDRIDFRRDAVFGVHDDRLALVGAAHVAFESDRAELGLSVLPAHRGRGLGDALVSRALTHARNRRIRALVLHFLLGNAPMMHIAHRFGMDIVTRDAEARARLMLPPASPASIAGEWVSDGFARCDRALRAMVAAWNRRKEILARIG
jgi:GNAT superfamily N-acetyltransferase